ncbi:hypothetical protein EYC84_003105 [Monilinia fructicola]|uniref:Uncharacterized protein n=1 Tax=Monilinia fructicola TaxID=38448 RepID=A0A5M9K0R5_MONFR|nr:hypothetical protein EYC84_003105 [Monilinia fructicola]
MHWTNRVITMQLVPQYYSLWESWKPIYLLFACLAEMLLYQYKPPNYFVTFVSCIITLSPTAYTQPEDF